MKDFIKMVAEEFVISRRGTHIGVVVFATRAVTAFGFNRYYSRISVFKAIDRIQYLRGGTRTGLALRRARRFLYNKRTSRLKVLVIMTDGITYDDIKKPTRQLHRAGVETYALGIGLKYSRRQLLNMATDKRHVKTSKFANLRRAAKLIVKDICRSKQTCIFLMHLHII
jgi:collagen type VI alpha